MRERVSAETERRPMTESFARRVANACLFLLLCYCLAGTSLLKRACIYLRRRCQRACHHAFYIKDKEQHIFGKQYPRHYKNIRLHIQVCHVTCDTPVFRRRLDRSTTGTVQGHSRAALCLPVDLHRFYVHRIAPRRKRGPSSKFRS